MKTKTIQCDNAGENMSLKDEVVKKQMGIKSMFIAPDTPQQNGVFECGFSTLYGKTRNMMNLVYLGNTFQGKSWVEITNLTTSLDNLTVNKDSNKSPCDLLLGEKSKVCGNLKVFGEMGI